MFEAKGKDRGHNFSNSGRQIFHNFYPLKCLRYCTEVESRTQGSRPRPRPRTAFPRIDTLEAKDRNARGQGQGPRTQAQVLSKKVSTKIFQALHKILTFQKIVLSLSRGQANFRGLEASRPKPKT